MGIVLAILNIIGVIQQMQGGNTLGGLTKGLSTFGSSGSSGSSGFNVDFPKYSGSSVKDLDSLMGRF